MDDCTLFISPEQQALTTAGSAVQSNAASSSFGHSDMSFDCTNYSMITETDNEESFASYGGGPSIKVFRKYRNWCVLQLSRGTGPRALEMWLSEHQNDCFLANHTRTQLDETYGDDDNLSDIEDDMTNRKRKRERKAKPVLANPHYAAYAQSLVLCARNASFLEELNDLTITVHCLVKGFHKVGGRPPVSRAGESRLTKANVLTRRPLLKPRCGHYLYSKLDGRESGIRTMCLATTPSNTAGYVSLLVAQNERVGDAIRIVPRHFRRHLKAKGWNVLGNAKDACPFRGESLCMSVVRLEFCVTGIEERQCCCIPPVPRLRTLLEREERFWRQRLGQEDIRIELFSGEIPRPKEYETERATFDGLEFRVTPAVMIPRKGSQALVDRAVSLWEKLGLETESPMIFDLGTGCGCLLVAILNRLRDKNAYGVGLDISSEVLEVADYNIAALGVSESAHTIQGKFSEIRDLELDTRFNLVVCNPPYRTRGGRKNLDATTITYEPESALFVGHQDRLVHYREILNGLIAGKLVTPGAIIVFEVYGDFSDGVSQLMKDAGLKQIQIGTDNRGCIRTIEGCFPKKDSTFWTRLGFGR